MARWLNFAVKKAFPSPDLWHLLRLVPFSETAPPARRLRLLPTDYALLRAAFSQLPRQSPHPRCGAAHYPDTCVNFLLGGGGLAPLPPGVRMSNRTG